MPFNKSPLRTWGRVAVRGVDWTLHLLRSFLISNNHVNLARCIRAHEKPTLAIKSYAGRPEAITGTCGVICICKDVGSGCVACGWGDGLAVGEMDQAEFVAYWVGAVPMCL